MIRFLPILFLLPSTAASQVSVLATPQPAEVLSAYNTKSISRWELIVCNDSAASISLPMERVRLMLPDLRIMDQSTAQQVIAANLKKSKRATATRLLTYGALLATTFTSSGLITASTKVVASLALGTVTLTQASKWMEATLPDLSAVTFSSLSQPFDLQPGACTTRIVPAAKTKSTKPMKAVTTIQKNVPTMFESELKFGFELVDAPYFIPSLETEESNARFEFAVSTFESLREVGL